MSTSDLLNPQSQAYKRARRQFYKATKGRQQQSDNDWTPFRAAEKKYKARFPPPDLSNVLDLAQLNPARADEISQGVWKGSPDAIEYSQIGPCPAAYTIPDIPGLVLLPSFVSHLDQRKLVRWALEKQARKPNPTNLDVHYHLSEDGLWNTSQRLPDSIIVPKALGSDTVEERSHGPRQLVNNTPASVNNVQDLLSTPKPPPAPSATVQPISASSLVPKLRWANIGWYYHWGTKQYDFSQGKGPIDEELHAICRSAVLGVDWEQAYKGTELEWERPEDPEWKHWKETYEPDAGIVNFYQVKDTLMAHVDRSEVCTTSPLVSISLGCAAVFLIGGQTRDSEPIPILLRSGDVVIMSGPVARRAYHGVPRILEETLPPHLQELREDGWEPFKTYLETTRINVNVRQVFPMSFNVEQVLGEHV